MTPEMWMIAAAVGVPVVIAGGKVLAKKTKNKTDDKAVGALERAYNLWMKSRGKK